MTALRWKGLKRYSGAALNTGKIIEWKGKIPVILDLSEEGKRRLKWLDYYRRHGQKARLVCRHFGISSRTFYKALNRFKKHGYKGLNDLSKRPHRFRQSKIPYSAVSEVVKIRKTYPTWSKYKIAVMLKRGKNIVLSASSVGRILSKKGLIREDISQKKKRIAKRHRRKIRVGQEIVRIAHPGDLLQLDTKQYLYPWGKKRYQFTAIDCFTRMRVLRVYTTASSRDGKEFLTEILRAFPFKIKRVQTDNGSEFLKEFRKRCRELGIRHFFCYPDCPDQNAFVESSHSTDEREFYRVKYISEDLREFDKAIRDWENIYNHIRPHAALGYLTPQEFYEKVSSNN